MAVSENTRSLPIALRRLLGRVAALAAVPALAVTTTAAAPAVAPVDPVLPLYARWRAARIAAEDANERGDAIRNKLMARWGEPNRVVSAESLWGHDPDLLTLCALNEASDEANKKVGAIEDEMRRVPITSLTGALVKVVVLSDVQPAFGVPDEELEYSDLMAREFLPDIERVLRAELPAASALVRGVA